jgi:hypothetical protein
VDTDCDGGLPDDEVDWDDDGWSQREGDCNEGDPSSIPERKSSATVSVTTVRVG